MKFPLFDRRSAERFAELLDETNGGRRHHTRGQADENLAELVAIGHSLSAARSGVLVDPEFRTGLRAMLVATVERDGIGTAEPAEAEPGLHAGVRETGRGRVFRIAGSGRRIRARGAIVIGVAAGAMAVSGISAASENASPGDALYGVKRSTERAQLAMAGSDVTRGQLSLDFARTRLTEALAMPSNDSGFAGVLSDMDTDTRQGVRLLTGSAVARHDAAPLGTVDTFVSGQRSAFEPALGKLSPDHRERALTSLALLDDVRQRTADLRTGLACRAPATSGTDALGPKLKDCTDGTDHETSPGRSSGTAQKQSGKTGTADGHAGVTRPEQAGTATAPDVTGTDAPQDGSIVPDVDPSVGVPLPGQSTTPAGDGGKGVLGGILGGILGN